MKIGNLKKIGTTFLLTPALLVATLPAGAQELHRRGDDHDRGRYQQRYDSRDHGRDYRPEYRGYGREQYRGGGYGYYGRPTGYVTYAPAYRGDYGYYRHDDGIGPGKGAAIGAVSGAILGALVGGGKGAAIGGAAGAGVGAIAGQAAQDRRYSYGY
jgi:hypothetical protein